MTKTEIRCSLQALPLPVRLSVTTRNPSVRIHHAARRTRLRVKLTNSFRVGSAWDGDVDSCGYGRRPVPLQDADSRHRAFAREYWPREKVFLILFVWYEGLTMKHIRQGTGLDTSSAGGGYGALNSLIKLDRTGNIRSLPRDLPPDTRAELVIRRYGVLDLLLNGPRDLAASAAMKIRRRAV